MNDWLMMMTISVRAAICILFTVFAVYDMVRFNRRRRHEVTDKVAAFEAGSLNEARLAYISGTATPEQTAMVEEATKLAEEAGVKLPPLLGAPSEGTLAEAALGKRLGGEEAVVVTRLESVDSVDRVHRAEDVDEVPPKKNKAWWKLW